MAYAYGTTNGKDAPWRVPTNGVNGGNIATNMQMRYFLSERKSPRLQKWDYRSYGYYFVTICTKHRRPFFGKVVNGDMVLSDVGKIAHSYWLEIPDHMTDTKLDEFVIMPNHVHGIIIVNRFNKLLHGSRTRHGASTKWMGRRIDGTRHGASLPMEQILPDQKIPSLSIIINQFKSAVKRKCNILKYDFAWHGRYHDRKIRDQFALQRIREYIRNNPKKYC